MAHIRQSQPNSGLGTQNADPSLYRRTMTWRQRHSRPSGACGPLSSEEGSPCIVFKDSRIENGPIQGHTLALTVLCVPNLLDSGFGERRCVPAGVLGRTLNSANQLNLVLYRRIMIWRRGRCRPSGACGSRAPARCLPVHRPPCLLFFFHLVTGPKRSLSLKLSDTRVYGP